VRDEWGLTRHLPRQRQALRAAFNSLCQSTGADHLRWIMNNIDREVCSKEEFRDCKLVLTMHDSLIYEVPESAAMDLLRAASPVAGRTPSWATVDMEVEVEMGRRFGEMQKVTVP